MSSRILISDKAREELEKMRAERIQANWKRRCSLKEIASEAILMFAGLGGHPDVVDDEDSINKEGF